MYYLCFTPGWTTASKQIVSCLSPGDTFFCKFILGWALAVSTFMEDQIMSRDYQGFQSYFDSFLSSYSFLLLLLSMPKWDGWMNEWISHLLFIYQGWISGDPKWDGLRNHQLISPFASFTISQYL